MSRLRPARLLILAASALAAVALVGDAGAFGVVQEPLPVGTTGQAYAYQFKVHGGNPPYTYSVLPDVLPPGLSLSPSGWLTGFPLEAGSWTFFVEGSYTYHSDPPRFSQRQFKLDVITGLSIRNRSLPVATRSVAYKARLTAAGGGAQVWSIGQGKLPPGLALAENGLITGLPTRSGTFTFTATVADDARAAEKKLTLKVVTAPVLTAPMLQPAAVGSPFRATVKVTGGLGPYSWTLRSTARPPGVTLSAGTLTGTPTVAGRYAVDIVARDAAGNTATTRLTLVVMPRLKLLLQGLEPAQVGRAYSARIDTIGGGAPFTYRLAGGALPMGMVVDTRTGIIAGRPRDRGRYVFAIAVADRLGGTFQRTFVLRVR